MIRLKRFIFISSVKAGGHPGGKRCASETDQFPPQGIYAKTKREAESGLIELSQQCDMDIVIARPALVMDHLSGAIFNRCLS